MTVDAEYLWHYTISAIDANEYWLTFQTGRTPIRALLLPQVRKRQDASTWMHLRRSDSE